jgi:hypothetical protein
MARPIPRRRGASAPAADDYAPRGRGRTEEDPDTERRPRRGRERGELPTRGRQEADNLEELSDDDLFDLAEKMGIPDSIDEPDDIIAAIRAQERDASPARSRRARSSEPDEPEPPARSRRGRPSRDTEPEPPVRGRGRSRSRDDEDEDGADEEPQSTRRAQRGFDAFRKAKKVYGGFDDFRLSEEEVLSKFLEDEPFAVYGEHSLFDELKEGQRIWNCLKPEDPCAICSTGHKPRPIALWNVVIIPEEGKPELVVLKAGPKLEKYIEKKAALKSGPMSKEYYSLSQTDPNEKGPVDYAVEVVRERELKDDWKTEPFSDEELEEFEEAMHDESYVKYPTVQQVKDVARKMRNAD